MKTRKPLLVKGRAAGKRNASLLPALILCAAPGLVLGQNDSLPADAGAPVADNDNDEDILVEEVLVTGSRIARNPLGVNFPMQSLSAERIEKRGLTNLADLLEELPIVANNLDDQHTARGDRNVGISTVNLRGLSNFSGANRTLVLVNGRRHVAGVGGSSAVNVGSIPSSMVERVEIATGGSSAVYGSEAIAGAVNFILKKDYEGVDISAQWGQTDHADAKQNSLALSWGNNFNEGRGNVVLSLQRDESGSALKRHRRFLDNSRLLTQVTTIDPRTGALTSRSFAPDVRYGAVNANGVTSTTTILPPSPAFPFGQLAIGPAQDNGSLTGVPGTDLQLGPDGALIPFDQGVPADPPNFPLGVPYALGGDGLPANVEFREQLLSGNSERTTLNLFFNHRVLDHAGAVSEVDFFLEGKYAYSEGKSLGNPTQSMGLPLYSDNPYLDPLAVASGLIPAPPGFPPSFPPSFPITYNRFNADLGPIAVQTDVDTYRFVGGFAGVLLDDYDWELGFNYGRTKNHSSTADMDLGRLGQAADAAGPPNAPVCRDPSNGCLPIDLLGPNKTLTAEQWAFISATPETDVKQTQKVFDFSITGPLTELPAGALKFAAGFEYREEASDYQPNAVARGETDRLPSSSGGAAPLAGKYDVWEVFGEIVMPLLSDLPLVHMLELDASVRFSDYSSVGGLTSWRVGGNWGLTPSLGVRGSMGTSLRAPNVSELFPVSTSDSQAVADLCSAIGLAQDNSGNRAANCKAAGVDPLVFPPFPMPFNVLFDLNPELAEEQANTYTVGLVWTPEFAYGLSTTVDFWSIEIDDAIERIDFYNVMQGCYDSDLPFPASPACSLITRGDLSIPGPGGMMTIPNALLKVQQQYANVSLIKTQGFDVSVSYGADMGQLGNLNLSFNGTLLNEYKLGTAFDSRLEDDRGEPGFEKFNYVVTAGLNKGPFNLFLNWRHLDGFVDNSFGQPVHGGSADYFDVTAGWQFAENIRLLVGASNLLDKQPDIRVNGVNGSYDQIGRRYFLRIAMNRR